MAEDFQSTAAGIPAADTCRRLPPSSPETSLGVSVTWQININSDMGDGYGRWAAVAAYDDELIVIAGQGWPQRLAPEYGLRVVYEGYIDQDYRPDGYPRIEPVKRPRDPGDVVRRTLAITKDRAATAVDGSPLEVVTPTLCLHGDMPNVLEVTHHVRERLAQEDVEIVGLTPALAAFVTAGIA